MKPRSVIIMSVPLALYVVSLFLPGIIVKAASPYMGYYILLIGIFGNVAWFANPVGWIAMGLGYSSLAFTDEPLMRQIMTLTSALSALAAFAIGLNSYSMSGIPRYSNIGPSSYPVERLGHGFYLWEASFALLAAIQVVALILNLVARRRASAP